MLSFYYQCPWVYVLETKICCKFRVGISEYPFIKIAPSENQSLKIFCSSKFWWNTCGGFFVKRENRVSKNSTRLKIYKLRNERNVSQSSEGSHAHCFLVTNGHHCNVWLQTHLVWVYRLFLCQTGLCSHRS